MFFGITDYLAYMIGTVAIILLPGPNSMYCLYVSTSHGVKAGFKVAAGIFTGDMVLSLASVFGAATLLHTYPSLFFGLKVVGGVYLSYLGFVLLRAAYQKINATNTQMVEQSVQEQHLHKEVNNDNVFLKSLVLSLSNPKAILFFVSFFVQFVDPTYEYPLLSFAILALSLQVCSMIYLSVLIFTGNKLVSFFGEHQYIAGLCTGAVGILFAGFAVQLWFASI